MRLAGEWNWWAPGPMRRFHQRFGVSEHVDLDDDPTLALPGRPATNRRTTGRRVLVAEPASPDDPSDEELAELTGARTLSR
jgi:hypothetical protein